MPLILREEELKKLFNSDILYGDVVIQVEDYQSSLTGIDAILVKKIDEDFHRQKTGMIKGWLDSFEPKDGSLLVTIYFVDEGFVSPVILKDIMRKMFIGATSQAMESTINSFHDVDVGRGVYIDFISDFILHAQEILGKDKK